MTSWGDNSYSPSTIAIKKLPQRNLGQFFYARLIFAVSVFSHDPRMGMASPFLLQQTFFNSVHIFHTLRYTDSDIALA